MKSTLSNSILDIALIGLMAATLEAAKLSLSFLMNVELVSALLIFYTLIFGRKSIYAAIVFSCIECMLWGFGLWSIMYFYIWPLLCIVTYCFRRYKSVWVFTLISAIFGLFFGALCSIIYLVVGGPSMMFTWWVSGIPADLIHCISNGVVMLVLYYPFMHLKKQLRKIYPVVD